MGAIDRTKLLSDVDAVAPLLRKLAVDIHENPELRFTDPKAAAWLAGAASAEGAAVDARYKGIETAFRASSGGGAASGAKVAILAEYDALPEIGHACGHNLIATGALGAFLALHRQRAVLPGTVELLGTPAEEGGGGKILLLEQGAFEGVDAAIMFHPFDRDILVHPTLSNCYLTFEFKGRPSHAAIAPWEGASALTAVMDTFRLVDSQRIHLRDGVRVHGFVTNGGQAVNIIPERASAEFSVRGFSFEEMERARAVVERCARAAALASDVELVVHHRRGYRDMRNNVALATRFGGHLTNLGRTPKVRDATVGAGSTDMGDVSHAVPSIHAWLAICDEGQTTCHQHDFARCARSDRGLDTMIVAAKSLALLAADVLEDPDLRRAAHAEHGTAS
jgi:amidohydrolase